MKARKCVQCGGATRRIRRYQRRKSAKGWEDTPKNLSCVDDEYDTVYSESGKVVWRVGRENKLWSGIEYAKQENKARHVSPIPFCRVWENAMAKRSAKERVKSFPCPPE